MTLFHLLGRDEWEIVRRLEVYSPKSLETEGFIHLSTAKQLLGTAEKWFPGRDDLMVLCIAGARLKHEVRFEPVGDQLFPHLYGPLNLDAVHGAAPLPRGNDGRFQLPTAIF